MTDTEGCRHCAVDAIDYSQFVIISLVLLACSNYRNAECCNYGLAWQTSLIQQIVNNCNWMTITCMTYSTVQVEQREKRQNSLMFDRHFESDINLGAWHTMDLTSFAWFDSFCVRASTLRYRRSVGRRFRPIPTNGLTQAHSAPGLPRWSSIPY